MTIPPSSASEREGGAGDRDGGAGQVVSLFRPGDAVYYAVNPVDLEQARDAGDGRAVGAIVLGTSRMRVAKERR